MGSKTCMCAHMCAPQGGWCRGIGQSGAVDPFFSFIVLHTNLGSHARGHMSLGAHMSAHMSAHTSQGAHTIAHMSARSSFGAHTSTHTSAHTSLGAHMSARMWFFLLGPFLINLKKEASCPSICRKSQSTYRDYSPNLSLKKTQGPSTSDSLFLPCTIKCLIVHSDWLSELWDSFILYPQEQFEEMCGYKIPPVNYRLTATFIGENLPRSMAAGNDQLQGDSPPNQQVQGTSHITHYNWCLCLGSVHFLYSR